MLRPIGADESAARRPPGERPTRSERDPGDDRAPVAQCRQHRRERPPRQVLGSAITPQRHTEQGPIVNAVAASLHVPDEPGLWVTPNHPGTRIPRIQRRGYRQLTLQPLLA